MSASEVIEQIKILPAEERRKVIEFLIEGEDSQQAMPDGRYADDATFRAAKQRVFAEHRELLRRLAQ